MAQNNDDEKEVLPFPDDFPVEERLNDILNDKNSSEIFNWLTGGVAVAPTAINQMANSAVTKLS